MADIINEFTWNMILDRIEERRCVPFLGAAVNISSNGYQGLPLGEQVAISLVRELLGMKAGEEPKDLAQVTTHEKLVKAGLDKDLARIALKNLPRVALHAQMAAHGDYDYFIKLLKTIIPDHERKPSKLLKLIASLPSRLIVTTNYDRLLENALDASTNKDNYRLVVQPVNGFDEDRFASLMEWLPTYEGITVYKIHGTFSEKKAKDDPGRIIVTEDDYIHFLTVIGKENEGVPNSIKEKLVDSTLLFLGYSLEDWDFRTLHKGLIEGLAAHDQRASFAIQKDPPEFIRDFWRDKGVTIYDIDVHQFATELEQRWNNRLAGA